MYVCMYVCMCMYIYTHTGIYIYVYPALVGLKYRRWIDR